MPMTLVGALVLPIDALLPLGCTGRWRGTCFVLEVVEAAVVFLVGRVVCTFVVAPFGDTLTGIACSVVLLEFTADFRRTGRGC